MGMGANELITLLGGAGSILGELKVLVDKTYGSIRGRTPAAIDGKKGYLIWDHMIWNEITFETDEGKMYSFFTSKSNEETEKVWKALAKKYRPTMSVDETMALLEKGMDLTGKVKKFLDKNYGFIHKRIEAKVDGKKGYLIWDYIIWNEISFLDDEGKSMTLFSSISDKETEEVWNELVLKYGTEQIE